MSICFKNLKCTLQKRYYNQNGDRSFNKDKLMNVGFIESLNEGYNCFIFHDVDMILLNDKPRYTCQSQPVHFTHYIDKFEGIPYNSYLGECM